MELPRVRPAPRGLAASWQDDHDILTRAGAAVANPTVRARLPQFFHVGPTRTATTWAWEILKGRANVSTEYKELFFFAQNFSRGFDWYLAHFQPIVPGVPRIDIEPEYFPGKIARERVASLIPQARIICSLRDPVERLFSFYKILARSTSIPPYTFEEACERDWRLSESARYGFHLQAWIDAFGAEKVLVLFYEDLLADPQSYADKICDFVGIKRCSLSPEQRSRVHSSEGFTQPRSLLWTEIGKVIGLRIWELGSSHLNHLVRKMRLSRLFFDTGARFEPPDAGTVARIKARLRPEIATVERLTGRDLSTWKGEALVSQAQNRRQSQQPQANGQQAISH
jgi:hypothetical protein